MIFDKSNFDMLVLPRAAAERLVEGEAEVLRVYLYGLLHAETDPEAAAQELGIPKSAVLQAWETLQAQGLCTLSAEAGGRMTYALLQREEAAGAPEIYANAGFNAMLQSLFSDRELSYSDYRLFYELLEVYGLPEKVLLMLAEYCIGSSSAGNKVSMAYIRKVGRNWAKEGIDSIEAAQRKIEAIRRSSTELRELLSSLNILRMPTEQEFQLYQKWTEEWGFSAGAIRAAMAATTNAQYPTLKYLDGILKNLYQQGHLSAAQVQEYFELNERLDEQVKEVLRALSYVRLTVSQEQRNRYLQFVDMGFGQKEILLACAQAGGKSSAGLDYVAGVLRDWAQRGLKTEGQISAYLETEKKRRAAAGRMLAAAGYKRRVMQGDLTLYDRFTGEYGFPEEVVLFAASCAVGAPAPLQAMDKMLARWRKAGVHNLREAQQANDSFRSRGRRPGSLSDIDQRSYSEEQLAGLIPDPTLAYREPGKE